MKKTCALLEAAVSCGSPTTGTERAFDDLTAHGAASLLGDAVLCPMEKTDPGPVGDPHLRHLDAVTAVSRTLRANMLTALEKGQFPVVIGGDHSIAMGSLAALGEHYGAENVGLIYIDAHTDINTEESSSSGCIHGMDLAAACGLCCDALTVGKNKVNLKGENIHFIGARSIDPPEYGIVESVGAHLYPVEQVRQRGMAAVMADILRQLAGKRVHISFDVDALDPSEFTATGYNIPDGLTLTEVEQAIALALDSGLVCSFECVEYNPALDPEGVDRTKLLEILTQVEAHRP